MNQENTSELFHIHLVSDATGGTLESMAKAALVQFEGVNVQTHFWPMMRSARQMETVIGDIRENPGLVLYTVVDEDIREILLQKCAEAGLPMLDVLAPAIKALAEYLGKSATGLPGKQYAMDSQYFRRIDALHFSMAHDDGQMAENLMDSEIILIGVSRTSKTPTSIYLANRGIKTANVPFVLDCPMPKEIEQAEGVLILGLTVSPERLVQIRTNRLRSMNHKVDTNYVDMTAVEEEVVACRRYCLKHGWPTIDVTRRSIEETAAAILNLYNSEKRDSSLRQGRLNV